MSHHDAAAATIRLLEIMAQLRDPDNGCPWDRQQDFGSLVPYTLEEAYEVADAIERNDYDELRDELGDLLFQVVFYAQIGDERHLFDFGQVAQAIADKLVRRHPHVFAGEQIESVEAQSQAWEVHKRNERLARSTHATVSSELDGVARSLPALVRAQKLQRRAARVGFDWETIGPVYEKLNEEIAEVREAAASADPACLEDEVGDLLFTCVNLARFMGVDAEHALRKSNDKFERRFRGVERRVAAQQVSMESLTVAALDALWEEVKREMNAPTDE